MEDIGCFELTGDMALLPRPNNTQINRQFEIKKGVSNENPFQDHGNRKNKAEIGNKEIQYQSKETPFQTAESTFQKGFRKKLQKQKFLRI